MFVVVGKDAFEYLVKRLLLIYLNINSYSYIIVIIKLVSSIKRLDYSINIKALIVA